MFKTKVFLTMLKNCNIGWEGFPQPSIRYMPSNQIIGQRMIIGFHKNKTVTP